MKAGFINVKNNQNENFFTFIDVEDEIQEYYKLLDCNTIDIVTRKVGNRYYNFILDDEGLLKNKVIMGAMSMDSGVGLAGNLIITNSCEDDLTSLTEDDFEYIKQHIGIAALPNGIRKQILILSNN